MAKESSGAYSVFLGVVIAAALFVSIFWGLARFMPAFLAFADSRWAHLLPVLAGQGIGFSGWLLYRAKRRRDA
jgi:hypothetical protein